MGHRRQAAKPLGLTPNGLKAHVGGGAPRGGRRPATPSSGRSAAGARCACSGAAAARPWSWTASCGSRPRGAARGRSPTACPCSTGPRRPARG